MHRESHLCLPFLPQASCLSLLPSGPVSLPLPFEMASGEVSIPQSTQYLAAFNKVCWERLKEMKGLGIIDDLLFLFPFY